MVTGSARKRPRSIPRARPRQVAEPTRKAVAPPGLEIGLPGVRSPKSEPTAALGGYQSAEQAAVRLSRFGLPSGFGFRPSDFHFPPLSACPASVNPLFPSHGAPRS